MFCKGNQILIMEVCLQMDKWFTIDQIDEGTYIISEYRHWEETHCYLLNGSSRSLLIDTGLGICNIYDEVMKLTNKPVTAVATHIHWDHIGGHKYFPDFYAHAEELSWQARGTHNDYSRKRFLKCCWLRITMPLTEHCGYCRI